jgi:hypothetical protein
VASSAGMSTANAVGTDASGGGGLLDGDEVQVLIAGGIECTVQHDTGTTVRVVTASVKQISVKHTGGTPIKVTI